MSLMIFHRLLGTLLAAASVAWLSAPACASPGDAFFDGFDEDSLGPEWGVDVVGGWQVYVQDSHCWMVSPGGPCCVSGAKAELCGRRLIGDFILEAVVHRDNSDADIGIEVYASSSLHALIRFNWGGIIQNSSIYTAIQAPGPAGDSTYTATTVKDASFRIARAGATITTSYKIASQWVSLLSVSDPSLAGPMRVRCRHWKNFSGNGNPQTGWIDGFSVSDSLVTLGADLDIDGVVDGRDLGLLLSAWGTCKPACCDADIDNSGVIDGVDLEILLEAWTG